MTRKLFWDDPYCTTAPATVTEVTGDTVTLDATIFFAFIGGQEHDRGTIGGHEVLDARWEGPDIRYRLPPRHGLSVGSEVTVLVDPDRRARLRNLHMATEIVLELITQRHPNLVKVGAHISEAKGRVDFAAASPIGGWFPEIEEAANALIGQDVAIERAFYEGSDSRRYWEVAGFARVACGGTLPARTGEIGSVRLRRTNPGRGKERVEITVA